MRQISYGWLLHKKNVDVKGSNEEKDSLLDSQSFILNADQEKKKTKLKTVGSKSNLLRKSAND